MLLEVCIASADDAVVAAANGAGRLELNAALGLGGLTPSLGTLLEVTAATALPVWVMLRPRPGGFCYSDADIRTLRRDLDLFLSHGAAGVVFGILHADGRIDRERCRPLVAAAGGARCVFHRAFDVTPDPFAALEELVDLGFVRVLTSGQQATALAGADTIAALVRQARQRIEILPGGGINARTVVAVVARTGCTQVHASLREPRRDPSTAARPGIAFASPPHPDSGDYDTTSASSVAALCDLFSPRRP